jgi:hypothetical protein
MDARANRKVVAHRVLSATLAVVAIAGWSLYGSSVSSSGASERELRSQVADIWNDRARIIEERNRLRKQVADLRKVEAELAAAQREAPANESAGSPSPVDETMQPRPDRAAAASEAEADPASVTGAVLTADEIAASVRTAQAVLSQLGFGPLTSDGVMGPKTRKAIETFERANGLAVTGELGPRTVQALKSAAEAALQPPAERSAAATAPRD